VPIDPQCSIDFDPDGVPTLTQLVAELERTSKEVQASFLHVMCACVCTPHDSAAWSV
jgi:hypothetical protein